VVAVVKNVALNKRLGELQEGADAQYEIYKRSHEQLWVLLSRAYLWWREASQESGYLESLYKQREIGFRATDSNLPNFNPLIRLIWNMQEPDNAERVTISSWNKALQSVHERYLQNPDDFRHNPEGKLTAYIQGEGGVAGLTASTAEYVDEEQPATHATRRKSHSSTMTAQSQAEIARSALTELKAQKEGIGSVNVRETVRVGGDGLLVLLARREKNGHITVLGSSNDPTQIANVAALAVETNLTNLPPNLRAFTEVIATQTFPPHALPSSPDKRSKWYRTRYADKSDLWQCDLEGWTGKDRGERLRSAKKVLLRGKERDILLSGSRVAVSPVTRCILNNAIIDKEHTAFLRVLERSKIEQWIESKEITLLRAEPKQRLKTASAEEQASYKLAVTNTVSGFTKFLHFYGHTPQQKKGHYQADFQRDKFKADWSLRLGTEWFANLRQEWADKWFAELGQFNQILRPHNAVIELKVTANKIYVLFNLQLKDSPFKTFPFPEPIKTFKRTQMTAYFSKDLAPILFNLADAHINGSVTMAGNAHAIVFRYATQVGKFEIAVPTLDAKRKHRDGTLFYALDKRQ
jgi:hypothetical protein